MTFQKLREKRLPRSDQDSADIEEVRKATMEAMRWASKKRGLFEDDQDIEKSLKLSIVVQRLGKTRLDCYRIEHGAPAEEEEEKRAEGKDLFARLKNTLAKEESEKKTLMVLKEVVIRDLIQNEKRLLRDLPRVGRADAKASQKRRPRHNNLVRRVRVRRRANAGRDPQPQR